MTAGDVSLRTFGSAFSANNLYWVWAFGSVNLALEHFGNVKFLAKNHSKKSFNHVNTKFGCG